VDGRRPPGHPRQPQPGRPALRDLAASIGARTATHADAVRDAEVVVVALPGDAVAAMAAALGDAIDGNVVIDATNNVGPAEMNSIATIVRHAPGAVCARAFNSLGGENLADPDFDGTQADLLWCGPDGDPGARRTAHHRRRPPPGTGRRARPALYRSAFRSP
jgi:predicted dinucleotide-binding enzyme